MRVTLLHNPKAGKGHPTDRELTEVIGAARHKVRYQSMKKKRYGRALAAPADLMVAAGGKVEEEKTRAPRSARRDRDQTKTARARNPHPTPRQPLNNAAHQDGRVQQCFAIITRAVRAQVGRSPLLPRGRRGGKSEHYRAASQLTAGRRAFYAHADDKCNREQTSQRAFGR
jgi:hypothetical protein